MFDNAEAIKLYMSDFHMGEGVQSPHEDFKFHPTHLPMSNTRNDYVLDGYFADCVDWILDNLNHCSNVQLYLNGDTFDFSSVALPDKKITYPYEKEAVEQLQIIKHSHPIFFNALAKFCAAPNTTLKFFKGNHDWELNWPEVQKAIVNYISPNHPEKIHFLYEELDNGTYCQHGDNEPGIKSNHEKPIITCLDLNKLPTALKKAKLNFVLRDILDVPLSYYMIGDLMRKLKPLNYLIGRMHTHGFVWLDAAKNIGRESWYRNRWFAFAAAYHFIRTFITYTLFSRFWHIKMKAGPKKILQLIWWTITGVLAGNSPRDSAMRILRSNENTKCVMSGHEHEYAFEIIQVNNEVKTYINTGTWMPQLREKTLDKITPWKRLRDLQKFFKIVRDFFAKRELELVWKCPVAIENINADGQTTRQLVEWDREEKTLKQMV